MNARIAIPDDYDDVYAAAPAVARLRERAEVAIWTTPHASLDELVERIGDAEIVVANRERLPLRAELFDRLPALRLVAQTGGGGGHLDLQAATERGILVAGSGGRSASTAELTIGLMIAAMRRIPFGDAEVRAGRWPRWVGRDLLGKRLGVIGLGKIGGQVARVAQALGMAVSAWGPTLTPERALAAGVEYRPLDELLAAAEIVTLHVPLTGETRGLLDARRLALMPDGSCLINTARGPIVDEPALVRELSGGRLRAGLDVFADEPSVPAALLDLPNVVLTPHVGSATTKTREAMTRVLVDNIQAVARREPPPNAV